MLAKSSFQIRKSVPIDVFQNDKLCTRRICGSGVTWCYLYVPENYLKLVIHLASRQITLNVNVLEELCAFTSAVRFSLVSP